MSSFTSTTPPPFNYSYHAIAGAFAYGLVPHLYGQARLMYATKLQNSIAMPRTNLENFKDKLPKEFWNHLTRARGAHLNSMEVFPLFAAAMVAGNLSGVPTSDLNGAAASFFAARTVYLGCYLGIKNDMLAFARTGAYAWSIGIPLLLLWRAGNASRDI